MRISVEPEALRALSRQLEQSGEQIRQITASLNQALGSLIWETSIRQSLLNQWQTANQQGEQIYALLNEMGRNVLNKAGQFQTADQQQHSIMGNSVFYNSPVASFRAAGIQGGGSILPGYGGRNVPISNPSSAVMAVQGQGSSEDGVDVGWGYQGPTPAGWASLGYGALMLGTMVKSGFNVNMRNNGAVATIKGARSPYALNEGIKGTRYTLNNAAKNPQVWKFVDPKIAAKESLSIKGIGGKLGYAGLLFDTGVSGFQDYKRGGASRAAASVLVNGSLGLGTLASSAAIGAAVGSAVPVAGTAVGAVVGLASGVIISAVTDIEINGKSLKTYAVDGVDAAIDGTVEVAKVAAEGIGHAAQETFHAVSDSVKAVSHGASELADQVKNKIGSLGKMFA
ncbi:WXG100 family type VII secretion target [Paenibacillus dokdonensis]|uniref:WXG100 family type VII secretion target n=1 Tax=Paenibacillus dokdonensis TaxID=2567944 RepID=A0ABU6GL12_9BACL|nr:WXG100 family type VII secretion target [Paenibacillus dokdonensis]MEC0240405.1 WXG100 family type VII secretion target [Paenibacillus dokdonensis]